MLPRAVVLLRLLVIFPALLAVALAAAGCGREDARGSASVNAVATTTHVADLLQNVGGARVSVHSLLKPNSDPHEYEPRPSDARAIAEADVIVRSGGELDAWLDDLLDNARDDSARVNLIDSVQRIGDDPHWWQDPRNAERAVTAIRDTLVKADPDGADSYRRNAGSYLAKLRRLDSQIAGCMAEVPAEQRKMVTTHDAFEYFAERYDVNIVGALIPSLSTNAQPSAGETARLVDQIRAEHVKTIFPESALNPKLERAVARETGAHVSRALWADALGPKGSDGATYLSAMASNARELVRGFTDGHQTCRVQVDE
jgi:zinc/manganese transport system substrate-binding protein